MAINGANPLREMAPNLRRLNGYFYANTYSFGYWNFEPTTLENATQKAELSKEQKKRTSQKMNEFLLSKIAIKNPEIKKYQKKMLKILER